MRRALSALPGIFAALVLLGTIVFAIAAQMTEPPLEPALTLMRLQAVWGDGRYGPKFTFAVTWFITLLALFGPIGLITMCLGLLRSTADQRAMPNWPRIEWDRMREPTRAAYGVALTTVGLLFGGVCLYDPEMLTPVGFLAQIVLILCPFMLVAGPFLLLDVALPTTVLRGPVTALEQFPGATPQQSAQQFATIGEQRLTLPAALWQQLKVGDNVALRRSGGFERELELAREP
jgi:hypothetical protein